MEMAAENSISILIAGPSDFNAHINQLLSCHFSGFEIYSASNKQQLCHALDTQCIQVLILNLSLPELSTAVVKNLFEEKRIDIPVILISETASDDLATECLSHGKCRLIRCDDQQLNGLPVLIDTLLRYEAEKKIQQATEKELLESRERYLDIFENTSDLIQCVAPDGSFIYTNRSWRESMGYNETEISSLNLVDVLHPDSKVCCQGRFSQLLNGERIACVDFKFLSKSGETIHLSGDCGSIIKDGETVSTRGIFKNITDTVKANEALKLSEKRYQALYDNAPDIYTTISPSGEILSINRIGASLLGYGVDELIGESTANIIHPGDQQVVFQYIANQLENPVEDNGIEYRQIRKNGSAFLVHQRMSLETEAGETRLLVICRDVTDKRELEQKLAHQANHDSLTNLINRREFENRLQRILENTTANESHALCYMDLDKFKIINDSCGHIAGDKLLCQVTTLLEGLMRSRDTLARLGGDEFAVLMEHCTVEKAENIAEKIRQVIDDFQFHWRAHTFSIGISIGVVAIKNTYSIEDTLGFADSACYTAKNKGRNCVHVYNTEV